MAGEKEQQTPHQEEQDRATAQVGAIDMVNTVANIMPFGGTVRFFGKTDFEGHALNHMIDMVDSANPEHLETAGKALWDARDAIQEAAEELRGHIGWVEWEGESGTAFRDWGGNLVLHALNLASFAEVAGTQITAAATGLASVRAAMPPRDTRPDPTQTTADIPTPARVASNEEYAAAIKAEKDRQEAINQMNRLASFYAVSEETLAAQEPPTFEAMPDVGVPKPTGNWMAPGGPRSGVTAETTHRPEPIDHEPVGVVSRHPDSGETITRSIEHESDPRVEPARDLGTEIDSVGTLPPQEAVRPATTPQSPVLGTGGPTPPLASGAVLPTFAGSVARRSPIGGARGAKSPISTSKSPIPNEGRAGTSSGAVTGRSGTGPVGRVAGNAQSSVRGSDGAGARSPMGRGVTGGTPRTVGGPANGRAGGAAGPTGAARGNGVVGGRPTANPAKQASGSRVPRGTVVGAEGGNSARTPAGRAGQRGVIGAQNSAAETRGGQKARPPASNPDGVVGKPTGTSPTGRGGGLAGGNARKPQSSTGSQHRKNRTDDKGERRSGTGRRDTPSATD
ncbi:hypothetical protein AB0F77_19665 [Streptomyces sp. NPDC026672]|uniref:WXG100 family type VII secretion target n=1 Tax=unclassified Streptomyces TaxID=2593676 RepID=UPI0033CEEDAC